LHTSEFLNISAAIVPNRTAIIFEGKRFTYIQIEERSTLLANALKQIGVNPKDRIAIMNVNCNEHVELYFACAKLDAIYVPLNFRGKQDEIEFILRDSNPKVLIAGNRYLELLESLDKSLLSTIDLVAMLIQLTQR
jgi:acyl-CoA synthetase (AMP-forming)/AMP-acid ligase II